LRYVLWFCHFGCLVTCSSTFTVYGYLRILLPRLHLHVRLHGWFTHTLRLHTRLRSRCLHAVVTVTHTVATLHALHTHHAFRSTRYAAFTTAFTFAVHTHFTVLRTHGCYIRHGSRFTVDTPFTFTVTTRSAFALPLHWFTHCVGFTHCYGLPVPRSPHRSPVGCRTRSFRLLRPTTHTPPHHIWFAQLLHVRLPFTWLVRC